MIYGFYSKLGINNNILRKVHSLEKYMYFKNCHLQKHTSKNLILGNYNTLHNNNLTEYFKDLTSETEILISGYIYNEKEVAQQFQNEYSALTKSELIFHLYKKYNENFIHHLNGDFAISFFDPETSVFFLFRDHVGIQPLAFTLNNNVLCFSSDQVSLCRTFLHANEINKNFLANKFRMGDSTLLPNENVKKLLPGHFLKYTSKKLFIKKYWHPEKIKINHFLKQQKMLSDLKLLVKKSVKTRCDSNLNSASHMSGGLDSGIVAALVSKELSHQNNFIGYSWSSKKKTKNRLDFDERILVKEQADLNNITPVFITLTNNDYLKYISNPLSYSIFLEENKVLEKAKDENIRVLFSGYGGDEFISKGNRGIESDLFFKLNWQLLFQAYSIKDIKPISGLILYQILFPFFGIMPVGLRKNIKNQTRYLLKSYKSPHRNSIKRFYFYKSRKQLHLGFLYNYYLPERIEEWYINGIHSDIQYKYPLLDKNIVEYMLTVPSKLLIKDSYYRIVLREISEGILPDSVRWKNSGMDPALFHFAKKNITEISLLLINEIDEIKLNTNLNFIDFKELQKDIEDFKTNYDKEKYEFLLYAIFKIKQIHEYTKAYLKN